MLVLLACSAEREVQLGDRARDDHALVKAETHYRRALDKDAANAGALEGLGWTYQLAGEQHSAQGSFRQCVRVHPEHVGCLRGLANVAMTAGNSVRAERLLQRALVAAPNDVHVLGSMALLALAKGDVEEAGDRFEALVAQEPATAEYHLGLAEVRLRQKQTEQALERVEAGLKTPNAPARTRALLWQLRARILVAASAGREDASRCAQTAPPVRAWLDAAGKSLDQAEATGAKLADLVVVRRLVRRRHAVLDDLCPVAPTDTGQNIPGQIGK